MSASRHADEVAEQAALYAVGKLPESEARQFELRIQAGCPYCIAELQDCQRAVEDLVLAQPVAPDSSLEQRLFQKIGKPSAPVESETKILRSDEGSWTEVASGVRVRFLHKRRTMLVKMDPNSRYPTHTHAFDEQCLVVEGTIEDADGNVAHAGDFVFMAKGTTHPPLFSEKGALFLVAYT
jgi:quercetin dioxygenase-like cupin family protein